MRMFLSRDRQSSSVPKINVVLRLQQSTALSSLAYTPTREKLEHRQRRRRLSGPTMSPPSPSSYLSPKAWIIHGAVVGAAVAAAIGAQGYFLGKSKEFRSRAVGIIPARFANSGFQGTPLVNILGKPMIQRMWERAKLATTLDHVVVATDDEKIADRCRAFGADVIMTSESCRNGAERCSAAVQKLEKKYDIVVNIQGDEPLIEPEIIDGIAKALQMKGACETQPSLRRHSCPVTLINFRVGSQAAPDAVFGTAVTPLKSEDAFDPNRVKCIVDDWDYVLFFSRGVIPFNKSGKVNMQFPYMLHLGIQSYDCEFLKPYPELEPTPLQLEEDLEQLKILENGYKKKVTKVHHDAHGVNTPEGVQKLESLILEKNLS